MNIDLELFRNQLLIEPETIEFPDTVALINKLYNFTPTAFRNGILVNESEQNQGSCKLFAFARLHDFTIEQTLACFGAYYRADVLKNPNGDNHPNIRQFMLTGWDGIEFDGVPLRAR